MIWLVGNQGMLGAEMSNVFSSQKIDFVGTDADVDITRHDEVSKFVEGQNFSHIVNCAAYTNVDKAESEYELAWKINALGVKNLALFAQKMGSVLVHFSTDYVFDGRSTQPYQETDMPNPVSAYGKSKLEGERFVSAACERCYIFRISWLYGAHRSNFVKTMLRLFSERDVVSVVCDQRGAPTWTYELAVHMARLVQDDPEKFGIYHYSDDGNISWFDFACKIRDLAQKHGSLDKKVTIEPIPSENYPTPAVRPRFSIFDRKKIREELGIHPNPWEENLEKCIESIFLRT